MSKFSCQNSVRQSPRSTIKQFYSDFARIKQLDIVETLAAFMLRASISHELSIFSYASKKDPFTYPSGKNLSLMIKSYCSDLLCVRFKDLLQIQLVLQLGFLAP